MFGFAGAARSGKTTLAKRVAETMGIHYHDASISAIARELGVNAVDDLWLSDRIALQKYILKRYVENLARAPRPAVTDRTPLDMICYMLGEVTMHNTSAEDGAVIYDYVQDCLNETARHFDTVFICRPLPVYVVDPKSPPPNPAYQWQTQFAIEGSLRMVEDRVNICTMLTSDADARAKCAVDEINERLEALSEEKRTYRAN